MYYIGDCVKVTDLGATVVVELPTGEILTEKFLNVYDTPRAALLVSKVIEAMEGDEIEAHERFEEKWGKYRDELFD